jgi:hypothetical protein
MCNQVAANATLVTHLDVLHVHTLDSQHLKQEIKLFLRMQEMPRTTLKENRFR